MLSSDVTIIGGGPIGLFSIFQAGMLGMKCHLFDAEEVLGGQCAALYAEKPIYDVPAHPEIKAIDLVKNLLKQAAPFEPVYHTADQVMEISRHDSSWIVRSSKGQNLVSKVILISAGGGALVPNRPPIDGIEEFERTGSIAYKAGDPEQFRGKSVLIAGGGDSAVDWANILCSIARKVFFVHRRDSFRCAPVSLERMKAAAERGEIEMVVPGQISAMNGEGGDLKSVSVSVSAGVRELEVEKALLFYGLRTSLGPLESWGLQLRSGRIEVQQETCQTNLEGVYAAGDIVVYPGKLKLILTGFAEAATALHHAYSRVFPGKAMHLQYSTDKGVPKLTQ